MIRIKPNKCGYSNWSCQGIPQLSSFMFDASNTTVSTLDSEIYKLPVKIKGMVYTEDTINMGWQRGGPHPEIPELTCRKDTDPDSDSQDPSVNKNYILVDIDGSTYQYPVYGGTGGWLDLFNAGYDVSGSTQYFYHDLPVSGSTAQAAAVTDVYLTVDGSTTRNQIYDIDNIPSFQRIEGTTVTGLTVTELEMGPGLLEPMLDTNFDPIGIDTIPAWEAGNDSFIFEAAVLNAWKGVVDDRIRNIYARINSIHPGTDDTKLRELKNEEYREAECDNFPITLDAGGSALRTYAEVSAGGSNINTYTIGSGSVLVNGVEYIVEPVTGVTAPFYAYLNASAEYTSVFSSDTLPETVSSGAMYVSGGTVTEIISAAYPDYLWKWTVQYPWKTGASVEIRVVPSQPLPDVGRVGIGGVNVISGGTNADDFVLFKTFREDCIVSADLGPDDGLVNHIYPQENPPPDGPEYEAGPVFPYDNIMSGTTGTERTDWGHSAYVPTVNATYEFVHNDTYGSGDDMAATQALAHRYVTSGAETSILTYNYTQDDIPFKAIDNDMSAGLADLVTDAQARVDETSAAYVADPTEENLSAYNDAQAARDAAVTSSGLYANAAVVGGTPGTVFVVSAMIASGGSMLTPTPAEAAVPTLDAVDLYVHGQYSLAQWGSVARPSSGSPYVDHGYPGTVLTVDEIDDPLYSAGEYYYDDIPTVRAVVKYVKDHQTLVTDAESGLLVISGAEEAFDEDHMPVRGTVEVADNILVGGTPTLTTQVVPSVHAVHTFVTTYDAVVGSVYLDEYEPEVPEVIGGTTGIVKPVGNIESGTVDNSALDSVVPTALAVVEYIDKKAGPAVAGEMSLDEFGHTEESLDGSTAGIVNVARNIVVSPDMDFIYYSAKSVPTLEAVYNFIHGQTVYAVYTGGSTVLETANSLVTGGTLTPVTATGSTVITAYAPSGTQGTCYMATEIPVGTTVSIGLNNCAPTVDAVITYVEGHTSTAGVITLTTPTGSTVKQESISGHTVGMPLVASNILLGTEDPNAVSPEAVPTVKGVYDFIHYTPHSITGGSTADTFSSPMADITAMTATHPAGGGGAITGYTVYSDPGTVLVASDIQIHYVTVEGTTTKETAPYCVATAQAVVDYIEGLHLITESDVAVPDGLTTFVVGSTTNETWVHGSTVHEAGIVDVASNILLGQSNNLTVKVVPSVKAVYDFIHSSDLDVTGATEAGYGVFHQALATPDTLSFTTTGTAISGETISGGTPGTIHVLSNLLLAPTDIARSFSRTAVPSAEAVYKFVHNRGYGNQETDTIARALATAGTLEEHSTEGTIDGYTIFTGVPGTCWLTSNIPQAATSSADILSVECVPNAGAVVDFVDGRLDAMDAVAGYIAITGNTAETLNSIDGSTAQAGFVQPVRNMQVLTGTGSNRSESWKTVPTVEAVYNFIHGKGTFYHVEPSGYTSYPTADSLAEMTRDMTAATSGGSTIAYTAQGERGTVVVAADIKTLVSGSTVLTAPNCVPTAQAVVDYTKRIGLTAAMAGTLTISGTSEAFDTNDPAIRGTVEVAKNIMVLSGGTGVLTPQVAASVDAVYDFIHNSARVAPTAASQTQALATPGIITLSDEDAESFSGTPGTVEITSNILIGAGTYSDYAVPTVKAVRDFLHNDGTTASIAGALATVWNVSSGNNVVTPTSGIPGTVQVYNSICVTSTGTGANATSAIYGGASGVPTMDAVSKYVSQYGGGMTDAVLGVMSVNAGGTATIANIDASTTYAHGAVYVGSGVVSGASKNVTGEIVPSLNAVYDFVHTYSTTAGYRALATVHNIAVTNGAESIAGGTPGTLWLAGNIIVGSNSAYSTNAAASVRAVWDFVHNQTSGGAANGTGLVQALATGVTIAAPTQGGTVANLATGAVPGTCYVVTNMTGMKGTGITLNPTYGAYTLISVVPTVEAVKGYVDDVAGRAAMLGYIAVGTAETISAAITGETVATGMVYAVDNIDRNSTVSSRSYSSKAVPTVDAVIRYIHGEAATSGTMNDAKATAGTVVLATGSTDTATISGGTPGTTYTVSDMTSAYGTTAWTGSDAVPTVVAVRDYVDSYGGGIASVCYTSQTAEWGAITSITDSEGKSGTVLPYNELLVYSSGSVVSVGGQTTGVPTVQAVYNFVHSTYALATATGMTSASTAVTHSGTPGTYQVATDILLVSGGTTTAANCVPTAQAVVNYVELHGGGYSGPFKATAAGVASGHMWFNGSAYKATSSGIILSSPGDIAYAVLSKGASGLSAKLSITKENTATAVSYPVASNAAGAIVQLQYGDINVTGRWM